MAAECCCPQGSDPDGGGGYMRVVHSPLPTCMLMVPSPPPPPSPSVPMLPSANGQAGQGGGGGAQSASPPPSTKHCLEEAHSFLPPPTPLHPAGLGLCGLEGWGGGGGSLDSSSMELKGVQGGDEGGTHISSMASGSSSVGDSKPTPVGQHRGGGRGGTHWVLVWPQVSSRPPPKLTLCCTAQLGWRE